MLTVSSRVQLAGLCVLLAIAVFAVFGSALSFDFVNYDDNQYVYENPVISQGVSLNGLRTVLTEPHSSNWHPLTSLSHMLDCQIYGLNPFGHHLTNILLHIATVLSLFLVLRSMTGSLWRSACVAALFAIHPLRVESVVWVSERKDVLSGLFFVLTVGAYVRYVRDPSCSLRRYSIIFALFIAGLLSKPMLVTLPFILLLLDFWPLRRFEEEKPRVLFLEKVPLIALSILFCSITIWAQATAVEENAYPVSWRIQNAILSYGVYIRQFFWPSNLAVLYPLTGEQPVVWKVLPVALFLAVITVLILWKARRAPYLFTGWFWYLGMLVPVIGILQVGGQAHADRYTYLPLIGLTVLLVWLASGRKPSRLRLTIVSAFFLLMIGGMSVAAWNQTGYWCDGKTMWYRALDCTEKNSVAHSNLGTLLFIEGDTDGAIKHFEASIVIDVNRPAVLSNLAVAYAEARQFEKALIAGEAALRLAEIRSNDSIADFIRPRLAEYRRIISDD